MGATKSKWVGRVEQTLGRSIRALGELLGDSDLHAQGRAKEREGTIRRRTAEAILRTKGRAQRAAGHVRAAMGALTGDRDQEREGRRQARRGRVRVEANAPDRARSSGDRHGRVEPRNVENSSPRPQEHS